MNTHPLMRRQRGVTLIEAMVSLLVMAFGMVALIGLQGTMRNSADLARQRTEAVRLAQQEMETLRAYSLLQASGNAEDRRRAYTQIVSEAARANAGDTIANASFTLTRNVSATPDGLGVAVAVQVSWQDRVGQEQQIQLDSVITRSDPRLAGALSVPPDGTPLRRPADRHPTIPPEAKDLGDGRSLLKPPALASGVAWIFDNKSGLIIQLCSGLSAAATTETISAAELAASCTGSTNAMLLAGHVRFSTGETPDPELPLSPALPLNLGLVAVNAQTPVPSHQCFNNAPAAADPTRTQGVRYYCIVYPNISRTPPSWDGRLNILDLPLSGPNAYRVCRYSADYNADKSIGNTEHPLNYLKVEASLVQQNFLVVASSRNCPAGHPVDPSQGHFFNSATVEHQPDPR
ncbi:MAG: prepilin-type N-terminal cleavage/methylation domain-containing protein [Roseateles asaccharophilus]|uniref:prepilin-type N-terminal cleavage/methylation domain-containing protein n=1 Tax=Roseateles asaccharophilus TaxID=582607 RepID=UPI00391D4F4E